MSPLELLTLALVQGIAEFLPISSSGHLVVVSALFDAARDHAPAGSARVNIILHGATLLSILVFYFRHILQILRHDRSVVLRLIVGTIPAGIVGLLVDRYCPWIIENALLAGAMLPITGLMLLFIARRKPGEREYSKLTLGEALLIGCFQAFAILPGISRSGATIVAGLLAGMNRSAAATFAFLLAIPAIAGAMTLELLKTVLPNETVASASHESIPAGWLTVSAAVAFVVGLVALKLLTRWLEKGRLHYFAAWCIPLGVLIVVWQLAT